MSKNDHMRMQSYMAPKEARMKSILAFADIHVLVSCIPAILLPIFGFNCACILMRYKDQYNVCIGSLLDDQTDSLRYWIRLLESLTFAFSISYFFLISRPPSKC